MPTLSNLEGSVEVPEDLKQVLETARRGIEQEFKIAERWSAAARGQITVAGAWYAVAQTVAAAALAVGGLADAWRYGIVAAAVAGGLLLIVAAHKNFALWLPQDTIEVGADRLSYLIDEALKGDGQTVEDLARLHVDVLRARREENRGKRAKFRDATLWSRGVVTIAALELLIALIGRAFA